MLTAVYNKVRETGTKFNTISNCCEFLLGNSKN